jgi:hypothetical protein
MVSAHVQWTNDVIRPTITINGKRSLFMFSKERLSRGLELLLDAISSLNFEKIPPVPDCGESSGLTKATAKVKAKQESSPIVWENIQVPITPLSHGAPPYTQVVGSNSFSARNPPRPIQGAVQAAAAAADSAGGVGRGPQVQVLVVAVLLLLLLPLRIRCLIRQAMRLAMRCGTAFLPMWAAGHQALETTALTSGNDSVKLAAIVKRDCVCRM